jgi:redox-regulated HSP33 family molecular chaperone
MHRSATAGPSNPILSYNGADSLVTGLNGAQDISVKVVSCKHVVQETLNRKKCTDIAAKSLAEVLVCCLMMGANLKGEESQQVNLVGTRGLKNIMGI